MMHFTITPSSGLKGCIRVASDKSISHRTIILGAISEGTTHVRNLLESEDVVATIQAFRQMGVTIEKNSDGSKGTYVIHGVGLNGLARPAGPLDFGNSGTACRLLIGLLSAQKFPVTLIGDDSLSKRPMLRVTQPLTLMGACFKTETGMLPLKIIPVDRLYGMEYQIPVASAQVKSAILLAGLYAQGETVVTEPQVTRDHTERMLSGFGYAVDSSPRFARLSGGGRLVGQDFDIPADLSSAAFFIVAALVTPKSELRLKNVGINSSRRGILDILKRMGANIRLENERYHSGEQVADIYVRHTKLKGCKIGDSEVALAIDEIPVIGIAAACATGETVICDASELRVKESDRINAVATGLQSLGIQVEERPDGMRVQGGSFRSGEVDSYGDHRIAMAFSIAGLVADGPVKIINCKNVATSFPDFAELAVRAGMKLNIEPEMS